MITGNVIGGLIKVPDTIILVDENGNEYPAVVTEEEVNLDATANDIRLGTTAVTNTGVTPGEKVIPAYHTNQGVELISPGNEYMISTLTTLDTHNFTKLQAIICDFNSSSTDSVSANKIALDDKVYAVLSTDLLSTITKNDTDKIVKFGITNDTGKLQALRFFTYKEIE